MAVGWYKVPVKITVGKSLCDSEYKFKLKKSTWKYFWANSFICQVWNIYSELHSVSTEVKEWSALSEREISGRGVTWIV